MKKILSLIFAFSFIFSSPAYAHVLETDHSIGAVVHINPNDEPVAGSPTTIIFEIKDRKNKFLLENCTCIFSVTQSKNQLTSQDITPTSEKNVAVIPYTFPESGAYVLQLQGKPKNGTSFESFTLQYAIRVAEASNEVSNSADNNFTIILSALLGIAISSIIIGTQFLRKKRIHLLKK